MFNSRADSWDRARQTFAEQFEQRGTSFVYRRSQKGEAISVSAEERSRFIDEFEQNIRRFKWIMYAGWTLVFAGIVALTLLRGPDVSEIAIFAAIGAVLIPYLMFYRWAWTAPARELAGRTPIAGERSPEEVRRLRFQRISYGQLGGAAFCGVAIPFIGSSRHDVLSGWNRLWLVFGGALVLLAAVQAFRKWRFEQEESYSNAIPRFYNQPIAEPADETSWLTKVQPWRLVPIAIIVVAIAFIAFVPGGNELARKPSFWSTAMVAFGAWALFTVFRGFSKGHIEPFVRGFSNTYDRQTEPKRFWASMGWNSILGCLFLWFALEMNRQTAADQVQARCYNEKGTYSVGDVTSACNQLLEDSSATIRARNDDATAYFNRGYAYEHRGDLQHAVADFSEVVRLRPNDVGAYYYRWAAYKDLGDDEQATADLATVSRLDPKFAAELRGGK